MKSMLKMGIVVLFAFLLTGCPGVYDDDESIDYGQPGTNLTFDLTGAAAVGTAEISASAANLVGSSLLSPSSSAESAFGLVKILSDGSIEMAMTAPDNAWLPGIQFIATTPDPNNDDLYVSFENGMYFWDGTTDSEICSLLHIEADGTYYEVMPGESDGRVRNYSWWGDDSYKPVTFDSAGHLYFVWESWSGGDNVEVLYRYDPVTHSADPLTAQISGYHYNSFQVSPDGGRLFVQGRRDSYSGGTSSSFFRMYPVNNMTEPKAVYYASDSNVWVRGYTVAADGSNVIMNGWGIRGINGILRANIVSDTEITYDALFDSDTQGFSPQYSSWYSAWENKTYHNGLFDRVSSWDSYALMTDGSKLLYVRLNDVVVRNPTNTVYSLESLSGAGTWEYQYQDLEFVTDRSNFALETINVPTSAGTVWSQLTESQKSSVIFGYKLSSWDSYGSETVTFNLMSANVRDVLIGQPNSQVYDWNEYWLDDTGRVDYARVESYLGGFFITSADFHYGNLTEQAAWYAFQDDCPYTESDLYGSSLDNEFFLNTYFFDATTGNAAVTYSRFRDDNNLGWLDFANLSTMFYDTSGNLWGILGGGNWGGTTDLVPLRLLNAQGEKSLAIVTAISDGNYKPVGFVVDDDYLYFRDAVLDSEGFEIGYHRMYRIDMSSPNAAPEDVLTELGASNGRIEIVDFSIGEGFLYFTAVEGIQLIGGKISTTTLEYTPFDSDYVISNIEVY